MQRTSRAAAEAIAKRFARFRANAGITQPYGKRAEALDLGERPPPSGRRPDEPPGQQVLDVN